MRAMVTDAGRTITARLDEQAGLRDLGAYVQGAGVGIGAVTVILAYEAAILVTIGAAAVAVLLAGLLLEAHLDLRGETA